MLKIAFRVDEPDGEGGYRELFPMQQTFVEITPDDLRKVQTQVVDPDKTPEELRHIDWTEQLLKSAMILIEKHICVTIGGEFQGPDPAAYAAWDKRVKAAEAGPSV